MLLADGTIAVIRSLHEDDRDAVLELHESVSEDTLRLRFFSPSRQAGRRYVDHLFAPDNTGSAALVALVRGRVAGLATAELLSPDSAEVAFLVADEDRGRGLGSLLLEHLAALGRRHGVSRFEAEVLGDNYGMLRVFRAAGFAATRKTVEGEVEVELRTDASREAVEAADRREWRAAARSLRPLLHPTSVAVVGVRRSAGGFGHGVLDAIRSSSYAGTLHVIHPEARVDRRPPDQPQPGRPRRPRRPGRGRRAGRRGRGRAARGRRQRRRCGGRHLVRLLRRRERRASPGAAGRGPRAQPAPGRPQLPGRPRQRRRPQRDAAPRRARGRRPGGRLPVRRHGLRAPRPRP